MYYGLRRLELVKEIEDVCDLPLKRKIGLLDWLVRKVEERVRVAWEYVMEQ